MDGTAHGERRRAHFFARNVDVPMMIIAVDRTAQVRGVLPGCECDRWPPSNGCRCANATGMLARPPVLPAVDADGRQVRQKLMIFTSEATRHDGAPVHRALVRRLLESGTASGATVLRGIWGFHGDHKPHGDKLIQFGRQVPVISIVVDTPDRIARSFDIVDQVTGGHGLVTCEMVPALLVLDGGRREGSTDLADYRY